MPLLMCTRLPGEARGVCGHSAPPPWGVSAQHLAEMMLTWDALWLQTAWIVLRFGVLGPLALSHCRPASLERDRSMQGSTADAAVARDTAGSGPGRDPATGGDGAGSLLEPLSADDRDALAKLVGCLTKRGMKSRAQRQLLEAMQIIKAELSKAQRANGAEAAGGGPSARA
jgi:hypothetical protein